MNMRITVRLLIGGWHIKFFDTLLLRTNLFTCTESINLQDPPCLCNNILSLNVATTFDVGISMRISDDIILQMDSYIIYSYVSYKYCSVLIIAYSSYII